MERNLFAALALVWLMVTPARPADWPTWRCNAARTAVSPEQLPDKLHLRWVREYPPLKPAFWQARQGRVQFDLGYEPVVAAGTLVVGSSISDRVTALDAETGEEKWRFYTEGPVRLAPALWAGKVYVSSDDGRIYCLEAADGRLLWSRRGAPSRRKVLGNGRLISVWPARGGPVVAEGRVYFAAGVWPFEGIFVYALDAKTGEVVWVNDRTGSLYLEHPHGAMSFGGPAPQGYLLIHEGRLVVPSSRAFPAFFDLDSGRLDTFDFGHGGHGSRPGGWFVAADAQGQLVVDPEINTETHDAGQQVIGQSGVRRQKDEVLQDRVSIGGKTYQLKPGWRNTVRVGGREYGFTNPLPGVDGPIHSILAADGQLFVVSRTGSIYCFGAEATRPRRHEIESRPLERPDDAWPDRVRSMLTLTGVTRGYALVLGLGSGRLAEELALGSELHVIVVDPDAEKVDAFRRRLDRSGLYGRRIAALVGEFARAQLPPYLASLIVSEDVAAAGADSDDALRMAFRCLRPFGGTLCLGLSDRQHQALGRLLDQPEFAGGELARHPPWSQLVRRDAPPGAADYTGEANHDRLVRAPLGLLWFGDTFHHHKLFYKTFYHETGRGLPQNIAVVDGVMKYATTREPYGPNPPDMGYHDYLRFLEREKTYLDAYTDVYTGRALAADEVRADAFPPSGPPEKVAPMKPPKSPAVRTNPLTGVEEGRSFLKGHGCDRTAVDYGHLLTMRSGTAAFYDKGRESGTINVSGLRSGCRNSIVPGCGVLCLPSWTGNCTCNYPVYTSLALVHVPEAYEQWSAWGDVAVEAPIERVGLNFGAPGDRVGQDGTLWLDCPSVGGPSPQVPVSFTPEKPDFFYRHALWIDDGQPVPWVTASGVEGVRSIRILPVARKSVPPTGGFSVRWSGFVEPELSETYTFHVRTGHGLRLWVGDRLLVDNAKDLRRGGREELTASMALEAGAQYGLTLEYYQPRPAADSPAASAELSWSSRSTPKGVVPKQRLLTIDRRRGGLTGAYYENESFAGPAVLRTDPRVQFQWGHEAPDVLRRLGDSHVARDRTFDVELYFAEREDLRPRQRVFSVRLQGEEALSDFDVVGEAGGPGRSVVRRFSTTTTEGALQLDFVPSTDRPPLVCGIRLSARE